MEKEQEVTAEKLAECLRSFFKLLKQDQNNIRFVLEIAQQTIDKFKAGQNLEVSTKEIFLEIYPNQNDETVASSKLANVWKTLPKLKIEVADRLAQHARNDYGLNVFPWVDKIESGGGAGKLAKYIVIPIPIENAQLAEPNLYKNTVEYDIEYVAVQDFQPSWLAKLLFGRSNAIIGVKKWLMIFFPIIQMLFYIVSIFVFILVIQKLTLGNVPVVYPTLIIGAAWLFFNTKKAFEHFTDDRVIIASDLFMPWKELSLLQEMVTVNDENHNFLYRKVQLTKYVAVCPICEAQVELAIGEPDFPRRIIGRCKESPREHIYSFDRVTKLGVFLHQNAIRPRKIR